MNGLGPLLWPETTSEISTDSEEERPSQKPSNQARGPPIPPTRGFSVAAAAAPSWVLSTLAGKLLSYSRSPFRVQDVYDNTYNLHNVSATTTMKGKMRQCLIFAACSLTP